MFSGASLGIKSYQQDPKAVCEDFSPNYFIQFMINFTSLPKQKHLTVYTRGHQVRSWRAGVPAEFSSNPN